MLKEAAHLGHSDPAHQTRGKHFSMKTISFALVSASLLALTACGGGNKSTNTSTTNSTTVDPLANSGAGLETNLGTTESLGATNSTLGTTGTNSSITSNTSTGTGNGSISTSTNTTTTNTTTK
jgi:hypothetical protein